MTDWTIGETSALSAMLSLGVAYARIGAALNRTKNSAIGRARRLGFTGPRSRGPRGSEPPTFDERMATRNIFPERGHCIFPVGHPGEADFHFCGAEAKPLSPYCSAHHKLTYHHPAAE